MTNLLRTESGRNVYEFECACGASGEMGVPKKQTEIITHECGAVFVQKPARGMFGKPELVTVTEGK